MWWKLNEMRGKPEGMKDEGEKQEQEQSGGRGKQADVGESKRGQPETVTWWGQEATQSCQLEFSEGAMLTHPRKALERRYVYLKDNKTY